MDLSPKYKDSEGRDCNIHEMVKREPAWAATRIQVGEKAIQRNAELFEQLKNANQLLRSACSIAERQGLQTNWDAFLKQLQTELRIEHRIIYGNNEDEGNE